MQDAGSGALQDVEAFANEGVQAAGALAAAQHEQQRGLGVETQRAARRAGALERLEAAWIERRPGAHVLAVLRRHARRPGVQHALREGRQPARGRASDGVDLEERDRHAQGSGRQRRGQAREAAEPEQDLALVRAQGGARAARGREGGEGQAHPTGCATAARLERQLDALEGRRRDRSEARQQAPLRLATGLEPEEVLDLRAHRGPGEQVQTGHDVSTGPPTRERDPERRMRVERGGGARARSSPRAAPANAALRAGLAPARGVRPAARVGGDGDLARRGRAAGQAQLRADQQTVRIDAGVGGDDLPPAIGGSELARGDARGCRRTARRRRPRPPVPSRRAGFAAGAAAAFWATLCELPAPGRRSFVPTSRRSGSTPGLAAAMSRQRLAPPSSRCAIALRVSPAWTTTSRPVFAVGFARRSGARYSCRRSPCSIRSVSGPPESAAAKGRERTGGWARGPALDSGRAPPRAAASASSRSASSRVDVGPGREEPRRFEAPCGREPVGPAGRALDERPAAGAGRDSGGCAFGWFEVAPGAALATAGADSSLPLQRETARMVTNRKTSATTP